MARTIIKGLVGLEDLNIGSGTFSRATSTGGTQTLHQINSGNIGNTFPTNALSPVVPAGTVNGINVTFTLPTGPSSVCLVFLNGILQRPGVSYDYTISGTTITFNVAPLSGSVVMAVY